MARTKTHTTDNMFVVSKASQEELFGKCIASPIKIKMLEIVKNLKVGEKVSMPINLRGTAATVKKHPDVQEYKLTTRTSADKKCISIVRLA